MKKDTENKACASCCNTSNQTVETPGQAVDIADSGKVSEKRVDAYTKSLNNNPRNND